MQRVLFSSFNSVCFRNGDYCNSIITFLAGDHFDFVTFLCIARLGAQFKLEGSKLTPNPFLARGGYCPAEYPPRQGELNQLWHSCFNH